MTEVILQLKGEFAKVSGKDMHFDDAQFTAQKPVCNADLPKVSVEPVSVAEIKTDIDLSAAVSAMQKTAAVTVDVEVPAVPQMKAPELSQIEVKPFDTELKTVKITPCEIPAVQITLPVVDTVPTTLRKPEPIAAVKLEPISVAQIDTAIRLSEFSCNTKLQPISVEVPDTTLRLHEPKPVTTAFTNPDVPEVPGVDTYQPTAVQLSEAPEISVPGRISAVSIPPVEPPASEAPEIRPVKVAPYTPTALSPVVSEPEKVAVPHIGAVTPHSVTPDPIQVNVPQTKAVKAFRPVEQTALDSSDLLSDIQSDYPTVRPVTLPPVTMASPEQIEVPQLPDVDAYVQDILGSVV